MSIQRVMVIGAGQMGSGIAQVAATAGLEVLLHDMDPSLPEKAIEKMESFLDRDIKKGRKTEEKKNQILAKVLPSFKLKDAAEVDLVIEAVVEKMAVKVELFQRLDVICAQKTILASNTSSLPITEMAAVTNRPEKVIGMHFMNPVPVMKLVEVIRGLATSDQTFSTIRDLAIQMEKTPVEVNDFPGFVSNRVLMPMLNEAIFCVYEGVATVEAIDEVMKLGMNHPMGPLTLADHIGLDTCLSIMEVLYEGFGDSKYRPCPLLRKYVKAGWLGKKSGRGFYAYD
ncbi:3-hydroxybutyryl-CoA dehydrogenase [Alkalihalobacillus alcalophilus ATCC 27647 = CGMCC 1.3604]|uniref:3-hydroxybutyryl-CoA dehydrogenase n=1 Tax=Alkalihalobacillus alcalophilus ATCC 27647 = CGMCC 1.3604 TaxID=1218173 RepID=A0A094WJN0_ALKAL|nr:3-hydroxybutyryl-CoA dehydrogenase [Alkalihalobacillus alcalophilus]KGA96148.1 3-hydroxybutyryl-CoA dehydrogenase [Alkalihalobacillus alcalophilus ATCC 27647 = CGMCC 1.3604]MED1563184.1 3-hydroxybutyryl-CoA dehydrogenase [Alkalihalobacillus alcalophilus]THG89285.1 3-hydroxybutyryl-CoA dehydrogenase [Alkalihalobacillus alcalophilus ATCC 27647 = CGMCC 1.3604]